MSISTHVLRFQGRKSLIKESCLEGSVERVKKVQYKKYPMACCSRQFRPPPKQQELRPIVSYKTPWRDFIREAKGDMHIHSPERESLHRDHVFVAAVEDPKSGRAAPLLIQSRVCEIDAVICAPFFIALREHCSLIARTVVIVSSSDCSHIICDDILSRV